VAGILPGALSLPRRAGIRRATEIQALFQQGNRDERQSFVALWLPGPRGRRVAFAVSRRLGTAAKRNRVRRRIREAYRREQHALRAGMKVVFVGRPAGLTKPFPALLAEMRSALAAMSRAAGAEISAEP
jgi:ribonuclease P protein component